MFLSQGYIISSEKKEVRGLAAFGIVRVVRSCWLEDCNREKKEVPVLQVHVASDLLLPKGLLITMSKVPAFVLVISCANLFLLLVLLLCVIEISSIFPLIGKMKDTLMYS